MKKIYFLLLCGLLCAAKLNAQTWNIGAWTNPGGETSVTATLNEAILTISGVGAMMNWQVHTTPWSDVRTSIHTIIVNEGVTTIGNNAFYDCTNLTSVTINNSVTTIGHSAFRNTGLTSVIIPNSVTEIEGGAFSSNTALVSVTIPNSITEIGDGVFLGNTALTSIVIPNSVTTIGNWAFQNTGLASVVIPNSVTTIGSSAFQNTGLTSITIPNSVTTIGDNAFSDNTVLTSVTIGDGVTEIGQSVFGNNVALTSVAIGNRVTTIGHGAFHNSGLTSIIIPSSVTEIGGSAFENNTALATVTIGDSVATIGDFAFMNTALTTVIIPNSVTTIGSFAFENNTALATVTIGNSVTTIGDMAFMNTALTTVVIPNSVIEIGVRAFENNIPLTTVTIGNRVATIGNGAFSGCINLISIFSLNPTPPVAEWGTFFGVHPDACLFVPHNSISAYIDAVGWNNIACVQRMSGLYIINFNSQGGTEVSEQHIEYGEKIIEPTSPTRTGYTFIGWYTEVTFENAWNFSTSVVTQDTTLFAKWTAIIPRYTVTINSPTNGTIVVLNGDAPVISGMQLDSAAVLTLQTTPNIGYEFISWWDGNTNASRNFTLQNNVTISATFESTATSISDLEKINTLKIYPNPVTNVLHITHDWQQGDIIELFDMNGRRVFSGRGSGDVFTIEMSAFQPGNYILRIGNQTAKIVKQ